jgi:endonuclease/exonuclease/phosphatase family metal-dependent hydrolase
MRWAPLLLVACTHTQEPTPPRPDAMPDGPLRPPLTDLVPRVGSDETLEIMTWNIENFPAQFTTPATVADVIASLDVDIVVTEEIASETAWAELTARLAGTYDAVLSTHQYSPTEYQKIGVIYRRELVTAGEPQLLFTTDSFSFPRPPLSLPITVDGETIELVGVHLKCCGELEDIDRRQAAIAALDARFREQIDGGGENEIVLIGDYNQNIDDELGPQVLAPLLTAPERYSIRTKPLADAGESSYIGFNSFIDHITTTAALDEKWTTATTQVIDPRPQIPGYKNTVSDHLPVVLIAPRAVVDRSPP